MDVSKSCSGRAVFYYNNGTHLSVTVGSLEMLLREEKGTSVVGPTVYSLQWKVIQDLYMKGPLVHIGRRKGIITTKRAFLYWPGCTEAVKMWCRACKICASRKMTTPAMQEGGIAYYPDGLPHADRERRYYGTPT